MTPRGLYRPCQGRDMRVEFDRNTCIGMFQCVAEWDAFRRDEDAGKAILRDGEEIDDGIVALTFPEGKDLDANFAGRPGPVNASQSTTTMASSSSPDGSRIF